jgi:hypothetical protein
MSSDNILSQIKQYLDNMSEEEKQEFLSLLISQLSLKKESSQKTLNEQNLTDEEKHKMAIQSINRLLSRINKRILELDELKKQKTPLLTVSQ